MTGKRVMLGDTVAKIKIKNNGRHTRTSLKARTGALVRTAVTDRLCHEKRHSLASLNRSSRRRFFGHLIEWSYCTGTAESPDNFFVYGLENEVSFRWTWGKVLSSKVDEWFCLQHDLPKLSKRPSSKQLATKRRCVTKQRRLVVFSNRGDDHYLSSIWLNEKFHFDSTAVRKCQFHFWK